jgi:hypothetical protein
MIQLDFLKETDEEPKYWLIGLHHFELEEDSLRHINDETVKISNAEQTTPLKCTLCGLMYRRGELEKSLPLKMLIDLKSHMAQRKIFNLFPKTQVGAEQFLMHGCKICTICYELIVQESKLIYVLKTLE